MMRELKLTAIYEDADEGTYTGDVAELHGASTRGETVEARRANQKNTVKFVLRCHSQGL